MGRSIILKGCFTVIFVFLTVALSAQKYAIFGHIKDKANGESLVGATISVGDQNIGATSNNFGFYSLSVTKGEQSLKCSYIGYRPTTKSIVIQHDTLINVELEVQSSKLDEVVVTAVKNNKIVNNEIGSQLLSVFAIRQMPAVMGEPDLVKSLQLLPGIQTSNEGTTNLSVRGGSFDQNLFLLDDTPVYNPSHALGFFSVFK